jgi:glucose-1-phosphate adenylyltransferase
MAYRSGGPKVLVIVLAGGEGKRLMPLTADRAKPAVPFGGIYRLIDFALSNVVNSGYLKVVVLTQYKSHSLDRHVTKTWRMSTMLGNYVAPIPAQQRIDKNWYLGSADAIFQSLNTITDEKPDIVVVVGADHVYRMDFSQMVEQHIETGAGRHRGRDPSADRPGRPVRRHRGRPRGPDEDPRLPREADRPRRACPTPPARSSRAWATTSSTPDVLVDAVTRRRPSTAASTTWAATSSRPSSSRDAAYTYDFKNNVIPGGTERDMGYWRDVGTMDSYYDAHMDLVSIHPVFNLYNFDWPIYTSYGPYPPAKFVHGHHGRFGEALNSAVSPGVVISGARVNELGHLPRRARPQLHRDRRQRHARQREDRPPLPDPAKPSSTRT